MTSEAGTRPDLYVVSRQTFIEVKSEYTLFSALDGNRNKARRLEASGNHCRWVVVVRDHSRKHFRLRTLPVSWYRLTKKQIEALLC